jgi:hypothetical protein
LVRSATKEGNGVGPRVSASRVSLDEGVRGKAGP